MQIVYIISGTSPEYSGWLQIKAHEVKFTRGSKPNSDTLRGLVTRAVNHYMKPAGQKYHLYWVGVNQQSIKDVYRRLRKTRIPRYGRSSWFNTDVWTVTQVLGNPDKGCVNHRQLKPLDLARYLFDKYQREMYELLDTPRNLHEQRFKRDFFNTWHLSSIDKSSIRRVIKTFACYLLIRNLVNHVSKGYRKMFRKLIPLRMDDLNYDLKLLDYKFGLNQIIDLKNRINSLKGKPFGTAEFTNQYLIRHVKFLKIFDQKLLKQNFNL